MSRRKKRTPQLNTAAHTQAAALERFQPLLPASEWPALLAELEKPLTPALRVNPLKTNPGDVQTWASRYGWEMQPVPFSPAGWWIKQFAQTVSQTIEHRMGHYYIQEAASMLPVELFDIPANSSPLVLDLAASPGGKTTHLVARTLDRGLVIANDSGLDRITALRLVLQTWGAANIAATRFPAEKFGRWFPNTFDLVLLDAPCSMQSLRSTESHSLRPISTREQNALARRQTTMLISALAALKPGGQVVYSTCTLAPEENEAVLDAVLARYPNSLRIEPLEQRLSVPAPALASAYGHSFDPQVANAARLWPHRYGTAGFFAAWITKTGPVELPGEPAPARPLEAVGQRALSPQEHSDLIGRFQSNYGHDLADVLGNLNLDLYHSPGAVYAVPRRYLEQFRDFPCQLLGLKLVEQTPGGWQPAHDWVSRFGRHFTDGRVILDEQASAAWLRGQDVPRSGAARREDSLLVVVDDHGRILGRGRPQGEQVKNLLPRRFF